MSLSGSRAVRFAVVTTLAIFRSLPTTSKRLSNTRLAAKHVWAAAFLSLACFVSAETPSVTLNLMPMPESLQLGPGELAIDRSFEVRVSGFRDARLDGTVHRFLADLSKRTGISLNGHPGVNGSSILMIHAEEAGLPVQELSEDESYILEVKEHEARLSAPNVIGILHGLQTFLQLVGNSSQGFGLPVCTIHDAPRFRWRGLMVDVSRHFIPIEVLKRNLDGMAAVKANVFHWHLSDDQGFRVESKRFPKLHEMGSDRLFYTQEQVRDLIAYAHDRGIRVVPEFDIPGHATAWFVGYPNLASGRGPYQIERKFGVFDPVMDPTQEETYTFLDGFIGEMARLFPDHYFHIGGDEVNGKQWDANSKIQHFMAIHGLKTNQELQAYFNQRVEKLVAKHNKIMIGWDEVLYPGLPNTMTVQSWRGQAALATAAQQGHNGLLSFGYYLDHMRPAAYHYSIDPLVSDDAPNLTPEQSQKVLGGEACMWGEFVSPENLDSRIWPRMAVIAERLWSPASVRDAESMYRRMYELSWRLDELGLTHNSYYVPMLQRVAGQSDISMLRILGDLAEPLKEYAREEPGNPLVDSATPLNRLVDAIRPESEVARRFAEDVQKFIASQCQDPPRRDAIVSALRQWRDTSSKEKRASPTSFLVSELAPVFDKLAALSTAGLESIDYLSQGVKPPPEWISDRRSIVEDGKKPAAQILLQVAPAIGRLVEASAGGCSVAK